MQAGFVRIHELVKLSVLVVSPVQEPLSPFIFESVVAVHIVVVMLDLLLWFYCRGESYNRRNERETNIVGGSPFGKGEGLPLARETPRSENKSSEISNFIENESK
jgi:hypothetical protein